MTNQRGGRGSFFGAGMAVSAVVKAVCGAALAVMAVAVWQQLIDLEHKQELSANWAHNEDFAVFYPYSVGNDRSEQESGGNTSKITEARELYPLLDEAGAIFIDANNYEPTTMRDPQSPWPVPPIRVNTNYLAQFPIKDESGVPIKVDAREQDWVVAVPQQYKSQKAELEALFQAARTGGMGFEGATQAEASMVGEPVPEELANQKVKIIWTTSKQDVFSFNSNINPDGGNMITDPIVEIMTPGNSLTVDRLNSITGEMNTPLKLRVDGDPSTVLNELAPTLADLKLDDNLRHLVTGQEAILAEIAQMRSGVAWVGAFAGGALLVMLALSATLVAIASDRLRRRLTVRRLHGVGFVRTYRELLSFLGVAWLGQALLSVVILMLMELNSEQSELPNADIDLFARAPKLLAVLAVSLVIEAAFVVVTAGIVERRNAVKRLKEL